MFSWHLLTTGDNTNIDKMWCDRFVFIILRTWFLVSYFVVQTPKNVKPDSKYSIYKNTCWGFNQSPFYFCSCLNLGILMSLAEISQRENPSWGSLQVQDDPSDINIHKLSPVFYLDWINCGRSSEEASGNTLTSQNTRLSAAHPALRVPQTLALYAFCIGRTNPDALSPLVAPNASKEYWGLLACREEKQQPNKHTINTFCLFRVVFRDWRTFWFLWHFKCSPEQVIQT